MTYTLSGTAQYEENIKKSRFLALAAPVASAQEAMAFFANHHVADATHNCWAYRIGQEYRFNDDGEPGGTAGRPILQAIEGQQCDRVAVLVIRWFGGIKLGSGGLVRAYGGVAAQCLRLADKEEIVEEATLECSCPYSDVALLQSRFATNSVRVVEESFDAEGANWVLAVPKEQAAEVAALVIDLTRGRARCSVLQPSQHGPSPCRAP
ncbi:MAG TPA: YigZ family protein [Burkholderiaceae bacterium]|nr:YigZ family protein [Burkholderiaceae bacterium]